MILRPPVAAGTFYDMEPSMLRKQLDFYFRTAVVKPRKREPIARIAPHSPYFYSGQVAAYSFANLTKSNFVILGSNHIPYSGSFSVMKNSLWKTPIGEAVVDDSLANKLMKDSNLVVFDAIPHEDEFSIEVQLPFLLHKFGDVKILPVIVNNQIPDENFLDNCKEVGTAIGKLIKKNDNWSLLGSTDFSTNITKETVEKVDKQFMKHILKMDANAFLKNIRTSSIHMCGYGVVATTIFAAKQMGAKKAELLKYSTSADISEDTKPTGFASIIFY